MTCPRGLEQTLQIELIRLRPNLDDITPTEGGVSFAGTLTDMMYVNMHSRIGSRLLWRLACGTYHTAHDIYQLTKTLPWFDYFDVQKTFRVHAEGRKHKLKSLDFAVLKVKDAVCDQFRTQCQKRPSIDTECPDMRIHLFVDATHANLYLDTSGQALFKRGWRSQHF